jgi:hypothetical protein
MKTNFHQKNAEPSGLENKEQSRGDVPDRSGVLDLFQHFLALEAEGKSLNNRKAAVFATAKADGHDPKALRTAFRQRVREIEHPGETAKYGKLTDSYLVILRSEGRGDAGIVCSSPVSPAPAEAALEALTRSHAHTRTRESAIDQANSTVNFADTQDPRKGFSEIDVSADDEPDTPDFLRRSQHQQPGSKPEISTQPPTHTDQPGVGTDAAKPELMAIDQKPSQSLSLSNDYASSSRNDHASSSR